MVMMKTYSNFTNAYTDLVTDVYNTPEHVCSPRGLKIRERLGHSFRITDIRDRLPYVPHRGFSVAYFVAEMLWYLSANDSTDWISNYSAFWRNISDDGSTANSAYGARIFKLHPYQQAPGMPMGWSQWKSVVDELRRDSDSRRAVIHIRMPQDTYLASKDVPCTLALQFFVRDGALHQVASMRSSDIILGIAYDVPAFTMFQELLALELGVELGQYTHVSNSLHLYERHFEMAQRIIEESPLRGGATLGPAMPAMPSLPSLDELNWFETLARSSMCEARLYDAYMAIGASDLQPYWRDWAYLLAWHRAGKRGYVGLQEIILNAVSFSGYKHSFFAK